MRKKLYSKILVNKPGKQIVLTKIFKNEEIYFFQLNDLFTFQVIEGKLKLRKQEETISLIEGQVLSLHENSNYSLTTAEKSIFLLTTVNGGKHY